MDGWWGMPVITSPPTIRFGHRRRVTGCSGRVSPDDAELHYLGFTTHSPRANDCG